MEVAFLGSVRMTAVLEEVALIPIVWARHHARMDLVMEAVVDMEIVFLGNVLMIIVGEAVVDMEIVLVVAATTIVIQATVSMIGVLMASVTTFTTIMQQKVVTADFVVMKCVAVKARASMDIVQKDCANMVYARRIIACIDRSKIENSGCDIRKDLKSVNPIFKNT
jgi:hypothetical protein